MTALAAADRHARHTGRCTEAVELARYSADGVERVLCGRRVAGEAILLDMPAGDEGRVYLVERDLDEDGHAALKALMTDYVDAAARLGHIPMESGTVRPRGDER